jgi:hypothetical protein
LRFPVQYPFMRAETSFLSAALIDLRPFRGFCNTAAFAAIVMDPKIWTENRPSLRWWAALKLRKSQCHEAERVTRQA